MSTRPCISRLILAALMCSSFYGLSWSRCIGVPSETADVQIIEESTDAGTPLFVAFDQESVGSVEKPTLTEFPSLYFGVDKVLSVLPPSCAVMMEINHAAATAVSAQLDFMRNKDPPG